MNPITETDALARFCAEAADHPYVTVDTEFLRERTYYAQLCLVQLARPGKGDEGAVLIDTLSDRLSLEPLYELFRNKGVVKVFHAARQDLEIFETEAGVLPAPFFDTQVAAMVCGYGDQVGYETLVRTIARAQVDKSSRFTDWSRRPLSAAQMTYALADVTHLRRIYEVLSKRLAETGRSGWVEEELAVLTDPATYRTDPDEAWTRIKTRSTAPRFLAALRELARLRETLAKSRNVPRGRILKDDALLELAANRPKSLEELGKSRLLLREARRGELAEALLAAIAAAEAVPAAEVPSVPEPVQRKAGGEALADLLAGAAEGAGRGGGGGAAADRVVGGARRRGGGRGCAGDARVAARGLRQGCAAAEAGRDRAVGGGRGGEGGAARGGAGGGVKLSRD